MNYLKRWPAPKTFSAPGDEIKGTIVGWDESSEKYPVIHIREASGLIRIVRVTQARLHERLVELLPDLGDRIWIRFDGEAKKAAQGMSKAKEFTVEIRRADNGQSPAPGDGAEVNSGEVASENGTGGRPS